MSSVHVTPAEGTPEGDGTSRVRERTPRGAAAPKEKSLVPPDGRAEPITYLDAIRRSLYEVLSDNPKAFMMGEDIGAYGGAFGATQGLQQAFGIERVIDTPISESLIVGAAIGASVVGYRPIVEIQFADFIACAFDQIVNQAATIRYRYISQVTCPIVIRLPSGGNVHGEIYHSQNPEGWFFHQPGLKIVTPATVRDAFGLMKSAVDDDDPVLYFEYKYLYRRLKDTLQEGEGRVPLGKALLRREGDDLSIITYGPTLHLAMEAADALAQEGVGVDVVDLRTLVPMDWEAVTATVGKTGKVLVVHEDYLTGGIGAEIAARIGQELFESLDGPVMRVAGADTPVAFAPPLEEAHLPTLDKILASARQLAAY